MQEPGDLGVLQGGEGVQQACLATQHRMQVSLTTRPCSAGGNAGSLTQMGESRARAGTHAATGAAPGACGVPQLWRWGLGCKG